MSTTNTSPKVNAFLVGAPKCGTTSLADWLSQHPDICLSNPKESYYFSTDITEHGQFRGSELEYLNKFFKNQNRKILIDASTHHFISDVAIEKILKHNKDSKIIVALRNPSEMFISWHNQMIVSGHETENDPLTAWNLSEKRAKNTEVPKYCTSPNLLNYKKICSLGTHLEKLLSKVKKENTLVILSDQLKKNPDKTLISILDFLDISPDIKEIDLRTMNEKKEWRSKSMQTTANILRKIKRELGLDDKIRIGSVVSRFLYRPAQPNKTRPPAEISEFMRLEVDKIEKLLSIELPDWKK